MQSSASKNACMLSLPRFVVSFSSRWVWHGKLFFPYSCFDRGWYGNPWNRAAGWRWQWNLPAPTNKKTRFEYEIRKLSGPKYRAIKSAFQSKLKQGLHAPIPPPPPPPAPFLPHLTIATITNTVAPSRPDSALFTCHVASRDSVWGSLSSCVPALHRCGTQTLAACNDWHWLAVCNYWSSLGPQNFY